MLAFGNSVTGVDLSTHVSSQGQANCWAANGIQFVGRYLPVAGSGGDLNSNEIGYVHNAGMVIVAICSTSHSNGNSNGTCGTSYWNSSNGKVDGVNAANAMISLGLTGASAGVYIDLAEYRASYCSAMATYVKGFVSGINATPLPSGALLKVGVYSHDAILTGLGQAGYGSLMFWDIDTSSNTYGVALEQYTPFDQTLQGATVDFDRVVNTPFGGS